MDYRDLFKEENAGISQRYDLVMERIAGICQEKQVQAPFLDYFEKMAAFITKMGQLYARFDETRDLSWVKNYSQEDLKALDKDLYGDIFPENYGKSYGNPEYAASVLGETFGPLLSFVYAELRSMIVYAWEGRKTDMTIAAELFMEIYSCFESEELPTYQELKKIVYWYVSDYSDVTMEYFLREQMDDSLSFMKDIICGADLSDERYLYLYGEHVSENELSLARFMNRLSQEEILAMADTFVDGFIRGFQVMRMDLSVKNSVCIRAHMGFERVLRESIKKFEAQGLKVHIFRNPAASINKRAVRYGFLGTSPNPQYDYDHRQDNALYMDKALNERRLSVLRVIYEKYKDALAGYAGPAVMEVFGEEPFVPEIHSHALKLDKKQQELSIRYSSQSARLSSQYMDENNMSFTIIAYPVPEIGKDFEEIFRETVKINTLDNSLYSRIQQTLIDALDQADFVHVKGMPGKNHTDITVRLRSLKDPQKETKFENCVADVNIPAGEVFTSPVLDGTNGTLHVSSVYYSRALRKDLSITLKDGMAEQYTCGNFSTEDENKTYIKENILKNHESLPLGEFAIGTNTTAYVMAQKYQIIQKLPILIVEKTGPHFALGDTCYSRSEDHAVYNPDGKEIIARSNAISDLRTTQPDQAYFNCHTDITIPYDEIGEIGAILPDGQKILLIQNGRFVLPGTQALNEAFDEV